MDLNLGQASTVRSPYVDEEYRSGSITRSRPFNGREYDSQSVRSSSPPVPADPPYPKSYMEIMSQVQRGERLPNTRTWETGQPPSATNFYPQPPVINQGSSSSFHSNGVTNQFNKENSVPWWQQQQNVRITEVENEDGQSTASNNDKVPIDQPPRRRWVPPQPPPVALPEAADAIRRPKPSMIREQSADEAELVRPISEIDELQRITKISESGAGPEMNSGGSDILSNEVMEEQVAD